ncbi:MAG: T9SS type A sorting domain-containing protein, partial [Saprospiraceae bacterium]
QDDDGVADCQDNCPDSPNGERVNVNGCSCSQLTIDDGDFCTTDICRDGLVTNQEMNFEETTVLLENTNLTNELYTASQTITTNESVIVQTNQVVRFYAGNSIDLQPGFDAESGANFEAKITTECIDTENAFQENTAANRIGQSLKDHLPLNKLEMDIAPNPFNQQTTIHINLPEASIVSLAIYNLNGQIMERIIEKKWRDKGIATITYLPKQDLNGMYYLVLNTNEGIQTRPIVIVE